VNDQGQPGGDTALPVWAREKPRRRPTLSRDAIVEMGIKIADAEGLDAVSIRRVAGDLGVRPMSLYTYVDRKEDLVALMRDRVNGEVLLGKGLPDGWREALSAIARRTRDVVMRHRWMVDIPAHAAALGPNALRHVEESFTALHDLDLSPQAAAGVLYAVDKFVLGHVIFEVAERSGAETRKAAQSYIESLLATGEFPAMARIAASGGLDVPASEDEFECGLSWLLDGIAADINNGN
jgi:AcrR family transcriptional regulator